MGCQTFRASFEGFADFGFGLLACLAGTLVWHRDSGNGCGASLGKATSAKCKQNETGPKMLNELESEEESWLTQGG